MPLPGTPLYDAMSQEDKKKIDWQKVGLKSFHNYFSKSVSYDDFQAYLSKAYDIANNLRKKTVIRFGIKMFLRFVVGMFKKLWERPVPQKTRPVMMLDKG